MRPIVQAFALTVLMTGAAVWAQVTQSQSTQTQQSRSSSGSGQASATASGSASARGQASAGGSQSGFARGGGSANGFNFHVTPTHAVIYRAQEQPAATNPERVLNAQVDYWQKQAALGRVVYAGPWRDSEGGLVILAVKTDDEARAFADNDPGVKSNAFSAEVMPWKVLVTPAMPTRPGR
ncbi:MAG TPA: YciI family protein [Fimbriimonadaceae bacterium]|nr:YciI family protein [Fimbriimonadaceae bacterium]